MTEQEYTKLLERIIKGAEYLDNPLIKPEDYEKGMKLYDKLCEQALIYQARESWHVYNWMKYRYLTSGIKPSKSEVRSLFADSKLSWEEIEAGIADFESTI